MNRLQIQGISQCLELRLRLAVQNLVSSDIRI